MKTLTILVLAGAVALGGLTLASLRGEGVDPVVSGSIPAAESSHSYTISNIVAKTACLAERGNAISSRSARFVADKDCDSVWPGLASARTWTNNGDGTIVMTDAQGEAILTVVDGDGLAYEAVEPADAMVTMVSAD